MKTIKDNKVTIFKTKDGPAVDVQINNETVWLSQTQMAELFEKNRTVITRHINNKSRRCREGVRVLCVKSARGKQKS